MFIEFIIFTYTVQILITIHIHVTRNQMSLPIFMHKGVATSVEKHIGTRRLDRFYLLYGAHMRVVEIVPPIQLLVFDVGSV